MLDEGSEEGEAMSTEKASMSAPVHAVVHMTDFTTTESGLIVPVNKPEPAPKPEAEEVRDGFPVKAGWNYSKCGERYYQSTEEAFRMRALEDLYTAVDRGGGGIKLGKDVENRKRCQQLLNELAVELLGGIPEGYEEFT